MAFPGNLVCALTGATSGQLSYWRNSKPPVLEPQVARRPVVLYSFQDMVAIRSFVKLRQEVSLQLIRRALANMSALDLADHPSSYTMAADGRTIFVRTADGGAMDIGRSPGATTLFTFSELFDSFTKKDGGSVVPFLNPRPNVVVNPRRIGGWPTAGETRVPYDSVAKLMATGEVGPSEVARFYPTVSADAARDALDFAREVDRKRSA